MDKLILPRRLWYERKGEIVHLDESAIAACLEPLVILGEAGMGKTELTKRLRQESGHVGCTARQLLRHGARPLLGNATALVIDALDEIAGKGEGDAVDLVLGKLGEADFPRFVLTCRVADWRNATAQSALIEDYPDIQPLILHLEPLSDNEIIAILANRLSEIGGKSRAEEIIDHFEACNLHGLLGNPQTLELISLAVDHGPLPETKSALFAKAVEVLRREHRSEKIRLQPDEATALDAAGAAFAALILTGMDAVVRDVAELGEDELPWVEVAALPGAAALQRVIGSRLFEGVSAERFTYWHRRIGEYLGARWLARQANSAIGRKRLVQLFHSDALVPASLRGLHAWLAHQEDHDLAVAAISRDPMGVIEYGDADALGLEEARALLIALDDLAQRNPRFRDWKIYSIKSLMRPDLLPQVKLLIMNSKVELGLRALLLEALPRSPIASSLRGELRHLLLNRDEIFIHRSRAAEALIALGDEDWPTLSERLLEEGSQDSTRLALEAATGLQARSLSDDLLVRLVLHHTEMRTLSGMPLHGVERALPEIRLDCFLDALVTALPKLGRSLERSGDNELADLGYNLIARRLRSGQVEPLRLWRWLRPFDESIGFSRDVRRTVHDHVKEDHILRRTVQAHVLFDERNDEPLWRRAVHLRSRSPGFNFSEDDVVQLFDRLEPSDRADGRWKDLLGLIRHGEKEGGLARERAKTFVANRPDMLAWIDRLSQPRVPKWEIRRAREERRRESKRAMEWLAHRQELKAHITEMRRGEFRWLYNPARAYLGLFYDIEKTIPAYNRVKEWVGEDISRAAHEGFEIFLLSNDPPNAQQVANSFAESQEWQARFIIVSGAAERWRRLQDIAFAELSDDRLLVVFHEAQQMRLTDELGLEGLEGAVTREIEKRGLFEFAMRQWIEPQLLARRDHVDQFYELLRANEHGPLGANLAEEWLERFADLAAPVEAELIDRLLRDGRFEFLRVCKSKRRNQEIDRERRANWDAVAFVVDFEPECERLEGVAESDWKWLWVLRNRLGGDRMQSGGVQLTNAQLAWIFTVFRRHYAPAGYPSGGWSGNTNPWDASDFLLAVVSRLADDTAEAAVEQLAILCDGPLDGYTDALRSRAAEQTRKAVQQRYRPVSFGVLRAIVSDQPPSNAADLQAAMLALLEAAQARIKSSPDDAWRGFYDDRHEPRDEERCRDHLLTVLGLHPEGIDLLPEGHLANDKRADIIAIRPGLRLPIEIKGQWHNDLWRAADTQLERLYAADYAAERRGIYLVLWFGQAVSGNKQPKARAVGHRRPQNARELCDSLVDASGSTKTGYIRVLVLDVSKEI